VATLVCTEVRVARPVSTAPGALLPILDAEVVAINGVPVAALELPTEPHWLNPRHNPEPYLMAARFLIPLGITLCVLWGAVDLIEAIIARAATIEVTSEYVGIAVLGLLAALALLGGGKRGCPGLHCAGCRR
jgi:hypothetical protein